MTDLGKIIHALDCIEHDLNHCGYVRKEATQEHLPVVIAALRARIQTPSASHSTDLLNGVTALTHPNYHELNKHDGRNDRLLHAALCAYAKHNLDCDDIGWNQLGDILHSAICNEIGDDEYIAWGERIKESRE